MIPSPWTSGGTDEELPPVDNRASDGFPDFLQFWRPPIGAGRQFRVGAAEAGGGVVGLLVAGGGGVGPDGAGAGVSAGGGGGPPFFSLSCLRFVFSSLFFFFSSPLPWV